MCQKFTEEEFNAMNHDAKNNGYLSDAGAS